MATTRAQLIIDLANVQFGIVDISANEFAGYVEKFVHFGSKRYSLSKEDITVYSVPNDPFPNKEKVKTIEIDGVVFPADLESHLLCGTKFLDAVLWMHCALGDKPDHIEHEELAEGETELSFEVYNDFTRIAKMMFFYYFYILTRARAPEDNTGAVTQPVPRFLAQVLSITDGPGEVADYLASFELTDLDPAWVRGVSINGLSQESLSRLGLGVAGYRLASPFKIMDPDGTEATKYKTAIKVARSFATQPSCWDFHPATRNPNLLQKYGNINMNLGNLILKVYKPETINAFVKARILFDVPVFNASHTNYQTWDESLVYSASSPIFPSI